MTSSQYRSFLNKKSKNDNFQYESFVLEPKNVLSANINMGMIFQESVFLRSFKVTILRNHLL